MASMVLSPHEKGRVHMYQFTLTLHVGLVLFWVLADLFDYSGHVKLHSHEGVGRTRSTHEANCELYFISIITVGVHSLHW